MSTIYKKQFDLWNKKKKYVEARAHSENLYLHEREVWWCSVGVNIGVEIDGKNNVFEVKHSLGSSFANLAQLRLFSTKRVLRKVGMVSECTFVDVRLALQDLFKINRLSPYGESLGGRSQ